MAPNGDEPGPAAVIAGFGLGGSVTDWIPVHGAGSNRVYRMEADGRRSAVKEMRNPWADPRWQQWLAESWAFEQLAIAAGVAAPRPVPNPADGGCLAWVSRRDPALPEVAVRVHHWTDGKPVGPAPVEPETARWAGQALATLHGLRSGHGIAACSRCQARTRLVDGPALREVMTNRRRALALTS